MSAFKRVYTICGTCETLCREYGLEKAVERAVKECIEEEILSEFLTKYRAEAISMSIFEYNEEKEKELMRRAEYAAG